MNKTMDAEDIKRVNRLWKKVYPYLAAQVMENYGRDSGAVLELGPFSGGISLELAKLYPKLDITVRDWGLEAGGWRLETGDLGDGYWGLGGESDLKFDLIIFRGAFFFLGEKNLLQNIFRALKDGGMAFFGGGYGKGIPQEIIDGIAEESRILNDRLGRRRYSLEELKEHIKKAGLKDNCRIEEEGGVWLVIRKLVNLRQAFDIRHREVISLVGGGGKTTLMFALAHELEAAGEKVITTTTTRILEPAAAETFLIVEPDEERLLSRVSAELKNHRHITLAAFKTPDGKLKGISPTMVDRLASFTSEGHYIIVEADGAARKPLKAPNATEPVIPESTSLVIAVVGMDALGCRLTEENVFRPEIVSRLTGLPQGGTVSADTIATLITHTEGITKGSPAHARIVPLINKIDIIKDLATAEDIAGKILGKGHPQIKRVVLGHVGVGDWGLRVSE